VAPLGGIHGGKHPAAQHDRPTLLWIGKHLLRKRFLMFSSPLGRATQAVGRSTDVIHARTLAEEPKLGTS
jgi:hypothetical protein